MTVDLKIFDVEHGACALLTDRTGKRLMIDCGHNGDTGWRPGTYLKSEGCDTLEMLAVTNYDEDHVSGAVDLFRNVSVSWLWRNKTVSADDIADLKREDGMGAGMARITQAIREYNGAGTDFPVYEGVEWSGFSNSYPTFEDENNLSLAVYLKCHGHGVMFTGDLEVAGFEALLKQQSFQNALADTHVYIASHHGRESGCSEAVADLLKKAFYVVISDKGYMYDTQKTLPFYRAIVKGGPFRGEQRRVLTTRRDQRIGFHFRSDGSWNAY